MDHIGCGGGGGGVVVDEEPSQWTFFSYVGKKYSLVSLLRNGMKVNAHKTGIILIFRQVMFFSCVSCVAYVRLKEDEIVPLVCYQTHHYLYVLSIVSKNQLNIFAVVVFHYYR